jgi:hypothetical protein
MAADDVCVVMTLCSRPAYTRTVLKALERCDGIAEVPVYMLCEPVSDEVIDAAKKFAGRREVLVGTDRVGCNVNTYAALAHGFDRHARVIAMEDDTVPARDFLRFARWGLKEYQTDASVFSVCGYQKTPADEVGYRNAVIREPWFTPWGWATWRDRWESVRTSWPRYDHQVSWDTVIDKFTRKGRYEVRPMLARIQNIGAEGGAHVPGAAWHAEHHLNRHWVENTPGTRVDVWHEVPPEYTTALRRSAPC